MDFNKTDLWRIARNIRQFQDKQLGKEWTQDMRENFEISKEEADRLYALFRAGNMKALKPKKCYLIGSLRNDFIPSLASYLRKELPEVEVFDDWFSAGYEADDWWKSYEKGRGRTYNEALQGYAAKHVFEFDKYHLDTSTHAILVLPAGKSGHMEVTYAKYGAGAKAAILLEPEFDGRFDCMYQFVDTVLENKEQAVEWLNA